MKNITIAGNCTKDGEMRNAGSSQVCGFSVAVNGFANREKTVHYFDVSIWGKRGENAMQFAQKGAKICVTGDLGTRERNGKTYLTINASDFTPLGGAQGGNQGGGYDQSPQGGGNYGGGGQAGASSNIDDDEIPF